MQYIYRLAKMNDLDSIMSMVEDRIQWFKNKDIFQWRLYLKHHPVEEWKRAIRNCELYVVVLKDEVLGCIQFQYYDPEFWDNSRNLYIKKLCTRVGTKKLGQYFIEKAIEKARHENISKIRLDCTNLNEHLNSIYESYGFHVVKRGFHNRYTYAYCLREMKL